MSLPARISSAVDPVVAFRARCEARGYLTAAGDFDLHDAVDGLDLAAALGGLVDAVGQDAVQAIMAEAFRAVPRIEDAPPVPDDPSPPGRVPQSTLDAADFVRRRGDPDALRRWLNSHRGYLPGILEHWRHGR